MPHFTIPSYALLIIIEIYVNVLMLYFEGYTFVLLRFAVLDEGRLPLFTYLTVYHNCFSRLQSLPYLVTEVSVPLDCDQQVF